MFLCPTKDIHSVYLDNELPLSYIQEYESHVQSCPKCKAELESMQELRFLMTQDADTAKLSKKDLDESYIRLQMKMRYSKHTKPVKSPKFEAIKYSIPAIAAAAVFALVLPIGFNSKMNNNANLNQTVAEIPQNAPVATVSLGNKSNVILSGNIPSDAVITATPGILAYQKTQKRTLLEDDVFRPNFDNENTISIKITVSGINANPYTTEMELPVDLYKGYFE